jgi:chorismate synthase
MNTFGSIYRLTSFGESHGVGIGGVIDGCPSGLKLDIDFVQGELRRRRPGQSAITTSRSEVDEVEFLSGILDGVTLGSPIGFIVRNSDHHSEDYAVLSNVYRPSHADFTYDMKYGIRDARGGGRSSARETISRVVGGAVAKLTLREYNISITAYVSQVGDVFLRGSYGDYDLSKVESTMVRCPDADTAAAMIDVINGARMAGDTIGGVVSCVIRGVPAGLGEPVFGKLHAALGGAMLGINAAKGFEYGLGFESVRMRGSAQNDLIYKSVDGIRTLTNNSGGIQGGISNGEDIYFRVAFKAVPTLLKPQRTVDRGGLESEVVGVGRHDPCVVPSAVPIVESMSAMVILDYILLNRVIKL